jgi:hypothetical protein
MKGIRGQWLNAMHLLLNATRDASPVIQKAIAAIDHSPGSEAD